MPTPSTPDQPIDLPFPIGGVDVTTEFELQPVRTCPIAINVRAIEPGTQRNRGGSRPGISRYINDRPGGLSSLIQHLNIVVDPTVAATGAQDETNQIGPIPDGGNGTGILNPSNNPDPSNPRNNGNDYVPPQGSGHTMHRGVGSKPLPTAVDDSISANIGDPPVDVDVLANDTYLGIPSIQIVRDPINGTASVVGSGASSRIRYTAPPSGDAVEDHLRYRLFGSGNSPGSDNNLLAQNFANLDVSLAGGFKFQQAKTVAFTALNPFQTATFDNPTIAGHLIVAVVSTLSAVNEIVVVQGFTQVGGPTGYSTLSADGVFLKLSIWWKIAALGSPTDDSVKVTPSGTAISSVVGILEYQNGGVISLDGGNTNSDNTTFPSSWTTGVIPNAGAAELVVAAFGTMLTDESGNFTFDTATQRCDHPDGSDPVGISFWVGDGLDVALAIAQTATDLGGNIYAGIGASFKTGP